MLDNRQIAREWFINNHPLIQKWESDGILWCMHHYDRKLKYDNPDRYNLWVIDDLVLMTVVYHNSMHQQHKNSFKGKHHTPEARQKIREANTGDKNHMYGKHHSDDTKQKISEKALGRPSKRKGVKRPEFQGGNNPGARKVLQYSMSGEFIQEFSTVTDAAVFVGVSQSCISLCCNGTTKSSGGYKWKYKEENS